MSSLWRNPVTGISPPYSVISTASQECTDLELWVWCQIYNEEWSYGFCDFGTGVFSCAPKSNPMYTYRETVILGRTRMTRTRVNQIIFELSNKWAGTSYDLLSRNCNHFCEELCSRLGVHKIPCTYFLHFTHPMLYYFLLQENAWMVPDGRISSCVWFKLYFILMWFWFVLLFHFKLMWSVCTTQIYPGVLLKVEMCYCCVELFVVTGDCGLVVLWFWVQLGWIGLQMLVMQPSSLSGTRWNG